ncbi:hypothetical protein GCM10022262_42010 [Georgenia daeguensis]|uniref:Flp pilus-assembly TadG-like N-terminal domain-containing protein n=1 Tax=Georgenia daeguensis TaxID=908355 RepID=A0ABP6UQP8_9MICO
MVGLAVGLIAFALFSNIVVSDDTDAVDTAKACAEAREAGATSAELAATACDSPQNMDDPTGPNPTSTEVRAALAIQLTAVLGRVSQ